MKYLLVLLTLCLAVPTFAQTATPTPHVYTQGYYEFEAETSNMSTTGTWATENLLGVIYRTGTNTATITFWVKGKFLLVSRNIGSVWATTDKTRIAYASTYVDCLLNFPISTNEFCVAALPDSTSNYQIVITITSTGFSYARLDAFMVLSEPSLALPTPTEITFPPSPTPINTPVNTPTPAPTATPIGLVWAVDPAASYGMENGQITAISYSGSGGDVIQTLLLIMLIMSVWGMFFIAVFVLWRYNAKWRR